MKPKLVQFLSILVLIVYLRQDSSAEESTSERIRKHQEWLQKRRTQKQRLQLSQTPYKTSFELPNLWRSPKALNHSKASENPSFNEVFPENEKLDGSHDLIHSSKEANTTKVQTFETNTKRVDSTEAIPILSTTILPKESTTVISSTPSAATTVSSTLVLTSTEALTTRKPRSKLRPYPRWGNWSLWSECSRSCGVGVMYQQRKCINRHKASKLLHV